MTLAAVSDAGPISHLAEIDSLGLLSPFDTLLIPEMAYEEIEVAKKHGVVLLTDDLAAREVTSLMRSLPRETRLFVTGAVVERDTRMLDNSYSHGLDRFLDGCRSFILSTAIRDAWTAQTG